MPADNLVLCITVINFVLPSLAVLSVFYLQCKFSGVPKRDEYKSRMKKLHMAVWVWSITRFMRAVTSLWDINLLFGMMINISDPTGSKSKALDKAKQLDLNDTTILIIPMLLIVIFLVVEIWPIWVILDGNFVDIFLKYSVLIEQKDLQAPLLYGGQGRMVGEDRLEGRNDIEAMKSM